MAAMLAFCAGAEAQIPAFPGAEGAGAYAKGGRGGDVYHVTNTNASGVGSLQYGLTTGVPAAGRTIVFDVSGYAHISSELRVTASKITIAGQTAPGDGFGLKDGTFRISGDDIVIRHMRFRAGHTADAVDLDSGSINSILDHCDVMFGGDENFSSYNSPPDNLTFQWGLNAWGIESHSCGGLWDQQHVTARYTLWAHNHTRNPKARPSVLDWTNNVTYDWDIGFIMGDSQTPAGWKANVRGNYFICPPGNIRSRALEKALLDRNGVPNFSIFVQNNLFDKDGDTLLDGQDYGYGIASGSYATLASPAANTGISGSIDDPLTAYKKIVSAAGALRLEADAARPLRDEVGTILINNLVTLRRHHISSVAATGASNGGFGSLFSSSAPTDSDRDGMPDFWETALLLNAAVDDHNGVLSAAQLTASFFPSGTLSGYTWLEEYLHFLAIPHGVVAKRTASDGGVNDTFIDIDLRKFTSGFASGPVFALSAISGGTATLQPNGYTVRFAPALNTFGRGKFIFTVIDSAGSTWAQQCGILISAASVPRDLLWQGDNTANAWNSSANNWLAKGVATAFSAGDNALINDSGSATPAINLTEPIVAGAVTVDAAKNYTFSGSGSLGGSGALTKAGTGNLTIGNTAANTYSGGTFINSGVLWASRVDSLGSGAVTISNANLALTSAGNLTLPNAINIGGPSAISTTNNTNFSGAFSGAADVNVSSSIFTPTASWAGYSGKLTLLSGTLRFNQGANPWGAANAHLDAGASGTIRNRATIAATTITLGALSGGVGSWLRGSDQDGGVTDTYVIGGLNLDTTFAGTITNGSGASTPHPTALTKTGTGALTLMGANIYTGATTVSGGTLNVATSLGATAVTVGIGATLGVSGSIAGAVTAQSGSTLTGAGTLAGGATLQSGATVAPGTDTATRGALTASGGFSATTSTLAFDLSSSPGGANDRIAVTGGTGFLAGTNTFSINFAEGFLGAGNYKLIDCATGIPLNIQGGMIMNLVTTAPAGTRQTFALNRTAGGTAGGYVQLVVTGNAAALTWTGGGSVWDLNSSAGWSGGPTATFFNLDAVTFNDTATSGNVVIGSAVSPRAINVANSSVNYTFSGVGSITGAGALTKTGTGTLTIAPAILFVASTTTASSPTVTVVTAGLVAGMAVEGNGIPAGTTILAIVDAITLTLSQNATLPNTNATFSYYAKHSYWGGTIIGAGSSIILANDTANAHGIGTGWITLNGGTLTMSSNLNTYNSATYALDVPAGQTGTFNADSRCDLYGWLIGGGTLNFRVPWIRTTLYADWSAFTGLINVTTDGNAEPGGGTPVNGDFRMGTDYNFPGFPLATVHLGDKVSAYYTGILNAGAGTTIEIGELSGTVLSTLAGGATGGRNFTYRIGGKTLPGSEVLFAGNIAEQNTGTTTSFVKTGAGTWTLSGACNWKGGTTVEQGILKISGSVTSGAAVEVNPGATLILAGGTLSTDAVNVSASATLTATGNSRIEGDLNNSGTVTCSSGTFTITGDVVNNGTMRFTGGAALNATGHFVNNGVLDLLTGAQGLPADFENNGVVIDSSSLSQATGSKSGTTFTLSVRTYAGHSYQLQRADSLNAPAWTDIGTPLAGDGQKRDFVDGAATGGQRFYRVTVTP